MELQELSRLWNDNEATDEELFFLNRQLLKEIGTNKVRRNLHEIKWNAYFELIVSLFWIPFLVKFCWAHMQELSFVVPGLLLLFVGVVGMSISAAQLGLYFSIRPDDSVVSTQHKLGQIKYLEILDANSLLFLIPLFAAPFLIVMAKAILGIDLYEIWGGFLWNYTIGSAIVGVITVVSLRLFPNKKLREAIEFMKELKE